MSGVREIERAAVIGAGVMGAAIAAHFANAGVPTTLFNVKASEGSDPRGPARAGLQRAKKAKPAAFFGRRGPELVRVANLDDDLELLEDADWVIEAIVENLDIKQDLYARIAPYLDLRAIFTSNTSGLSIASLSDSLPAGLRPRFLATHFFNPPRYLHLLELVAGPETDPQVFEQIASFGRDRLGKGIVVAKDTPNFIANRVGVYAMMHAVHTAIDMGISVATVDALTGPLIGRPKSATFRTADVVGLDTLAKVAVNLADRLPDGPDLQFIRPPEILDKLVEEGRLGAKTRAGFYQKQGKKILEVDLTSGEYREPARVESPIMALGAASLPDRYQGVIAGDDELSTFLWRNLSATIDFSARCIPEMSDTVWAVDDAMRWGFGWEMGPFQMADAIGLRSIADRLVAEGREVPALIQQVFDRGKERFYEEVGGETVVFDPVEVKHQVKPRDPRELTVRQRCRSGGVVEETAAGRIVDLGEEVIAFELRTKRNAITPEAIELLARAVEVAEDSWAGLVIGGDADHFSAGANLKLVLETLGRGEIETVDRIVRDFQQLGQRMRYSNVPVVAATRGQTLAGGCELVLAANRVCASAETYIGLVELGAGLIPAGGGLKELLRRADESIPLDYDGDLFPWVKRIFLTVGTARVATSAVEAQEIGFLASSDRISMNSRHVLQNARDLVHAMHLEGYQAGRPREDIRVLGRDALATLRSALFNMHEGQYITDHDHVLADRLAWVLCGGDLSGPSKVSEQYLLDLERTAFVELCQNEASQARMKHILETGKPLRN